MPLVTHLARIRALIDGALPFASLKALLQHIVGPFSQHTAALPIDWGDEGSKSRILNRAMQHFQRQFEPQNGVCLLAF